MIKSDYAERFGRWIQGNEIVIEFDTSPDSWKAMNDTCFNLVENGFNVKLGYAQGQKCPHAHIENFNRGLTAEEKEAFMKTFIPSEHLAYVDLALCHKHRIAREGGIHFKYGTIKEIIGRWNEDRYNIFPEGLEIQKQEERRPSIKGSGITSKIVSKLSIIKLAKEFGLNVDRKGFAVCPFHQDNNPSLKFYDSEGRFYCFGCQAHGNIIIFNALMRREHEKTD